MPLNKPSVGGLEVDRGLVSQRQGTSLRRTARLVQIAGQPALQNAGPNIWRVAALHDL
jgi:hypothetical protein